MAAYAAIPSYLRPRRAFDARRSLAFVAIGAVHVVALAALFLWRHTDTPPQPIQPMMVAFISEALPQPEPTPPPPEPVKPKPQPKMIATPSATPSAITAPPLDEPPVDEQPVAEAPPSPPAPAAPAAPPETVPPEFVAAYLNNPGPKYPQMSMKLREQGTVMLLVLVSAEGRAEKVMVESGSGHSRLDDAAVDVVKRYWRFVPAKQGAKAVSAWVKVPITFELNQKR